MNRKLAVLQQLIQVTWDGDIICSHARDELVKSGYVERGYGVNWLTKEGVKLLVQLDLFEG